MTTIIDSHVHVGEFRRHYTEAFATSMMRSIGKPPEAITTVVRDLLQEMDAAGVAKAVILAFDAQRTMGVKVPDDYVAELCHRHPSRLIGLCSVDGASPEAADAVRYALETLGLRGVKTAPAYLQLSPADPCWYPVYEIAQAYEVPVLVHTGFTPADGAARQFFVPGLISRVMQDFPRLRLIAAHLGSPWVAQCLDLLVTYPYLYADISIFGWYQPIEIVAETLNDARARGVFDRLLWGSDYPWGPVAAFRQRMDHLRHEATLWPAHQPLSDAEWSNLMGATAARLFLGA